MGDSGQNRRDKKAYSEGKQSCLSGSGTTAQNALYAMQHADD